MSSPDWLLQLHFSLKLVSPKLLATIFTVINSPHLLGVRQKYVTCGSVLKLMNSDFRVRLHSHDVKYGTGSGQQSITGTEVQEDVNSYWTVKPASGSVCQRGEAVKCGSVIRLEHLETKKNLHSHYFQSPLSGNQEISCYGDEGEGDTGDHWIVVCSGNYLYLISNINYYSLD